MLSRRAVILGGLAASAAVPATAGAQTSAAEGSLGGAALPSVLRLQRREIEVNGKPASVFGILQPNGASGLVTDVGNRFRVRVENGINEASLIHWHGLTPPWRQDGVPGISGPPIPPGGSADYDFPLRFGGTFWMHSHQGLQEQRLMAAPLIIRDARDNPDQQDVVIMLADFSFTPPEQIFQSLRKASAMASMGKPAGAAMASMSNMRMGGSAAPDLNDVKYDAFLANDRTLADPDLITVDPGGRVLLRIINSSSMSAYHLGLGQLDGELIAVDGFEVEPLSGKTFPIAVAQRLDIRITIPSGPGAYPVLAQLEGERDRTGVVLVAGSAPVVRIPDVAETPSPALTLDLESRLRAKQPLATRKADRVHALNLTGEMAGYVWSINGVSWNTDVPPLPVAEGERVELVMVNRTPMPHPMHLHGHEFQVVDIDGRRFAGAVRDTVLVPPGRRVVAAFDAEESRGYGPSTVTCSIIWMRACSRRSNTCDGSL